VSWRRRWASCAALLAALAGPEARAEEPGALSSAECAQAYEQAQEQRRSGQLAAARDNLRLCARDECPSFIHDDCLAWHGEVQAELPTLVFSATSGGRDLIDVTVTAGDTLLALRLEGQVIELDPGEHDLSFSASGMRPKRVRFVVARGERNRLVRVELVPLASPAPIAPEMPNAPSPQPERSLATPAVLTGVALAGLGGFVALGAWGRSSESKLAASCAPRCEREEVADARTKYVLADVSLGVGVVSLALAAYTFLRSEPQATSSAHGVRVQASARELSMTYGGDF
jgi:hypothetical protein